MKMSSRRYLIHVAYNGKSFRGFQKQVKTTTHRPDDPSTVQGQLEIGLKILNPSNDPAVIGSSRTDSGVHALNTTCHVDLHRSYGQLYEPRTVTLCLNKYFKKEDVPIRVLQTYVVPDSFHCRHMAISRTYLYRMARIQADQLNLAPHLDYIPIEELDRCHFICTNEFDVEKMRKTAKLFEGIHDFRTFMGQGVQNLDKITRKSVFRVNIEDGRTLTYSPSCWPSCVDNSVKDYRFYDIYIQAKGFLYKQVRRMVGALIAVAQGKVSDSDIKLMLQIPSHRTWNERIRTVPARGLYLCEVEYSEVERGTFRRNL